MKKLTLVLTICLFNLAANGQDAASLLQKGLAATGNWGKVKTLDYKTLGNNYNIWQNYSFRKPVAMKDEAIRSFDFSSPAYYYKTISRYGGGYVFEFVNIGKDTSRYVYDVLKSRNGHQLQQAGKRLFDAGLQFVNETFPYYMLETLRTSGDPLTLLNDSTIKRQFKDGSHELLVFNQAGLLIQSGRVQGDSRADKLYMDYTTSNGLTYPKKIRQLLNGSLLREDELVEFSINQPFDKNLLNIPPAYQPAAPPQPMKATELAKNVYLVTGISGRNVLFINLDDGILVTEAPVSLATSQSVIDLIHKTLPGKKIKYVHLSHFHNDHINGLNAFLAEGASLIAAPATIDAVKTFIKPEYAASTSFIPVTGKQILKASRPEIRFYAIKNTHAEGMSFVYLPKEQILYQGDLYSLPDDRTITPAIEVNKEFYRFLLKHKLPVQRIIGHHGANDIRLADLEAAIKMKN